CTSKLLPKPRRSQIASRHSNPGEEPRSLGLPVGTWPQGSKLTECSPHSNRSPTATPSRLPAPVQGGQSRKCSQRSRHHSRTLTSIHCQYHRREAPIQRPKRRTIRI